MTRADAINALALVAALLAAGAGAWLVHGWRPVVMAGPLAAAGTVTGHDGVAVTVQDFRRIVSLVPSWDDAAADLGLLSRFAAISTYSREHSTRRAQLAAVPATIPKASSVEDLLALRPDLVLLSTFGDGGRATKLRAAGITVFNVGDELGIADAERGLHELAELCGDAPRGEAAARAWRRRLLLVPDPERPRESACYVGCFAGKLSGGTQGTSFGDVITAVGFTDAAAAHGYTGWPDYRVEDLIAIDPDVIICPLGNAAEIRRLPGAEHLRAVVHDRLIEVDGGLLAMPGVAILDAAQAVALARARRP